MRVGEIDQAEVGEDGFGHVDDHIARIIPRGEDADFGLALGHHGTIEETDAGMTSAGVGQGAQRRVLLSRCWWLWLMELLQNQALSQGASKTEAIWAGTIGLLPWAAGIAIVLAALSFWRRA